VLAEEGDNKKTAEAAAILTADWIKRHQTLCRIVRHTQLDRSPSPSRGWKSWRSMAISAS
jgi:hypothetical protein